MTVNVRHDSLGRIVTKHHLADLSYEEYLYNGASLHAYACISNLGRTYNLRLFDESGTCTSVILANDTQLEVRPVGGPVQSWSLANMLALHSKTTCKDLLLHLAK